MLTIRPQRGQRILYQQRIGTVQTSDGGFDPVRIQVESHWLGGVRLVLITGLYIARFTRHDNQAAATEAAKSWLREKSFNQYEIEDLFTVFFHEE